MNANATLATDHPTLLQSVRRLPAPVWVLCVGMFVNKFGAFVMPFLTLYLQRRGFGLGNAAAALTLYGVGNLLAAFAGGWLADRIGRRRTIVISMAGGAVSMLALSQADALPVILLLVALTGFSSELYRPAAGALLADVVAPEDRVTAFAVHRLAFNAGWAFGPAVAGLLASISYFWLFVGDALTCALFGAISWLLLPKGVRGATANSGWGPALRVIARDRAFLVLLVGNLAIGAVFLQFVSTYGVYVKSLGFDERTYGLLLGLNGLLVVLLELPLTQLTRRRSPVRVIAFGWLLVGLGALATAFPGSLAWLFVAMGLFTLGEIVAMPVASAFVSQLAPDSMRGRYMGAVGFVWSSCLLAAPAGGLRLHQWHPPAVWIAGGALAAAAAAWIRFASPPIAARNDPASGPAPDVPAAGTGPQVHEPAPAAELANFPCAIARTGEGEGPSGSAS